MLRKILQILFDEHIYEKGKELYEKNKKNFSLKSKDNIYFSTYYSDDFKNMIYELKYKKKKYVAKVLAEYIKKDIDFVIKRNDIKCIIPVPISKKRYNTRGFNQVELILENLNLDFVKIEKIKDMQKMSKLKKDYQKNLNIRDTFNVKNKDLDNKNILIVDDILTTGATIKEIEENILREYKNVNIYIYVLAASRQFLKKDVTT